VLTLTTAAQASTDKELMNAFLVELTALKKYMVSETKFNAQENEAEIALHLKEFTRLAKEARHSPELNAPNFTFSREILEDHISDTERLFRAGKKTFARWQLNATVSVCASCHSQLPASSRAFSDFKDTKLFANDLDKAEFLYSTRAFEEALPLYRKVIDKGTIFEADTAIQRELTYYLRIKRDPKAAVPVMIDHSLNAKLWPTIKSQVQNWISQLEYLSKQPAPDFSKMTKKQFDRHFKSKPVKGADLVTQLYVSGLLLEFLNTNKNSKLVPDVLYQLAIVESSLSKNFFFSLSDMYLKACMLQFPQAPVAVKCYEMYEEETTLSYTGSAGTSIPEDIQSELNFLKKLVKNKGKVKVKKE
jgi:hypothetical protein